MSDVLEQIGFALLAAMVMVGTLPLATGAYQFALIGIHGVRNHLGKVGDVAPRTAVVVPAWNEALVVGATIDRLLGMDYPADALRIYVVDDASTDETPEILAAKARESPNQVFPLRREKGGEGKAHTLNHGLAVILADDWAEAIMIIDADVIFADDALRKMARHLADPEVGSVTAYIKEGSVRPNYLARFIGFEYITAQAAARRTQNVLGAMACLAGGAQLHSRTSLEAIGGRIDTSTLAEDTITTFETQLHGRRALFDGTATVWAEEPATIVGLWKQRLRWGRGNVQVTRRYRHVWFRRKRGGRLGGVSFGLLWFSIFLMPVFLILGSTGLIALYFLDRALSTRMFELLWIVNAAVYLFVTMLALSVDGATARRTWREGILFPGIVSLVIILAACVPPLFHDWIPDALGEVGLRPGTVAVEAAVVFSYLWLTGSMLVAWFAKLLESRRYLRRLSPALLYLAGYGPLLCAVTFASYIYEVRGADNTWDKTEKTGKVALPPAPSPSPGRGTPTPSSTSTGATSVGS